MSDDIFCGVGKVPNGKRRGTMQECFEKNQVRYWGVKKVDSRILKELNSSKNLPKTRGKLMIEFSKITGKIKRLNRQLEEDKKKKELTKTQKESIDKEIKKHNSMLLKVKKEIVKIDNEKDKTTKKTKKTVTKKKSIENKPKKTKKTKKTKK